MTSNAAQEFLQALLSVENGVGLAAWKTFLFNPAKVLEIDALIDKTKASQVLTQGLQWSGGGWNTTSAAKALRELTGVPLVTSNFGLYRDSWLYGLALYWDVAAAVADLQDLK